MEQASAKKALALTESPIDSDPVDDVVARLRSGAGHARSDLPLGLLEELAEAIYTELDIARAGEASFASLFAKARFNRTQREFIASCLLRAIAADRDAIPKDIKAKSVLPFFDAELGAVYKRLALSTKDDAHRKWTELVEVAPAAEALLTRTLADVTSITDVRRFQGDVMHVLNEALVNAVVRPALPAEAFGAPFRDIVAGLARLHALTGHEAFEHVRFIRAQLSDYRALVNAHRNCYAASFLLPLADRLERLLGDYERSSGITEAAVLELRPLAKRYPLHLEDLEVSLRFALRNTSRARAFDVRLSLDDSEEIVVPDSELFLGEVDPGDRQVIVPALVANPCTSTELTFLLEWEDPSGETHQALDTLSITGQEPNVEWDTLDALRAYPQGAVRDDTRLVGRTTLMSELVAAATGAEVASVRISGQKRIGKSSIVRSLASRLHRLPSAPITVYVDVNKLMAPPEDSAEALRLLMRKISDELRRGSENFGEIPVPSYASLAEFGDFLDELRRREPGRSFLVIIDEFDELPNGAFERGGPGDALFRGFKAFSSDGDCGFILVGGERLDLALAQQSDRLNGFVDKHVDYLDEEEFAALVQRPVDGFLRFDPEALQTLWSRTGGHPWNTLIVCREIVTRAKAARDNHVTVAEVEHAYAVALNATSRDPFSHIWYDGAFADGPELIVIANRRVKVLLAWGQCLRANVPSTEDAIVAAGSKSFDLRPGDVREELRAFVRRRILATVGDQYEPTSRFFGDWLRDAGVERLTAGDPNLEEVRRYEAREEQERVRSAEVVEISDRWPTYQAAPVGTERIAAWLEQFGEPHRQRMALALLQNVRFYSPLAIREAFTSLHREVRKGTHIKLEDPPGKKQILRRDFAIAYVEPDGKSASTLAKAYASANRLAKECVTSIERVARLLDRHPMQRLVIVDDFIGTGSTMRRRLKEHQAAIAGAIETTGRTGILAVVAGLESGVIRVQEAAGELGLDLIVEVHDVMDESDKAFSPFGSVFKSDDLRLEARQMVEQIGRELGSDAPLGTGACEALIVFEHNTPNNTLPILWKDSASPPWRALFPRATAG